LNETKYQVFISSTYSDLIEERESIIKAILEMYHIPIGMEMFSAEDEDQWEIIRRTIEVSDYYILVLGLRYGSKTSDGISFTQKEYEYALEKKIPILAFVMNDKVSLSKDKRDDDLSEINIFRENVLKNSKMAQFWETKDELIRNVSISLMKQIMQKPGVGWVRGDRAIFEAALSKELTNLSKDNRALREKINDLESQISPKRPQITLNIAPFVVDDKFENYKKIVLPEKLDINEVEDHLRKYISEEKIQEFNANIPNQSEVDDYNVERKRYLKVENYFAPLIIKVCNVGKVKANNLYIDIKFPDEILIFEKNDGIDRPKSPIPLSPIRKARMIFEAEQKKSQNRQSLLGGLSNPFATNFGELTQPKFDLANIQSIHQSWWTKLDKNELTIKIDSLLHTRCIKFDDEYMIAPLSTGKHDIEVQVICEELETQDSQVIEIDVQEKL